MRGILKVRTEAGRTKRALLVVSQEEIKGNKHYWDCEEMFTFHASLRCGT